MAKGMEIDPVDSGFWFLATDKGKPQLGAYMPSSRDDLAIFWRGDVAPQELGSIVEQAERMLKNNGGEVAGTLFAFGQKDDQVGPFPYGLSEYLLRPSSLSGFDAYRAELTGRAGKVVVWANVNEPGQIAFEDGGDNIGLNVPPALFDGPARPVLSKAIKRTMSLGEDTIKDLLDQISRSMLRNDLKPA